MHMFTALRSGVYVRYVYGNNKMYTPTIILLCALSYYKSHNFTVYKNNGNKHKNVYK